MVIKAGTTPTGETFKKKTVVHKEKTVDKSEFEQTLLDNFVNLQKVLTNIAVKFDTLSDQISKLLQLFEISAKSFAEKSSESEIDGESLDKLDTVLEQNKIIAKGIMLMEERMRTRNILGSQRANEIIRSKPLPRV